MSEYNAGYSVLTSAGASTVEATMTVPFLFTPPLGMDPLSAPYMTLARIAQKALIRFGALHLSSPDGVIATGGATDQALTKVVGRAWRAMDWYQVLNKILKYGAQPELVLELKSEQQQQPPPKSGGIGDLIKNPFVILGIIVGGVMLLDRK
jgi:hypothetical protein